jgi:hypothetical protein
MAWIEPLELETWIINIFSGTPEIFLAVSLLVISGMAGFFRMTGIALFFMLGIFTLMFFGHVESPIISIFAIIGGLVLGYWISSFIRR